MKLWSKGDDLDREIERFTVGDDPEVDRELLPYDCRASQVHARVLERAGVLTADEAARLSAALDELREQALRGELTIEPGEEDGHTAIENRLVAKLGDLGKKIHTARSRNDQVLTALRLAALDRLASVDAALDDLAAALRTTVAEHGAVKMPGYTHTRKAMPSSVALWAGSFIDALADDKALLTGARHAIDQSPLGSGAGYGIPVFDLDREYAARELGFARVQVNPLYVQNSRGKLEATVVSALLAVLHDLNRLASDVILFTTDEFGFFTLPRELCTGSSIMPQKQNPDVLELVRARYHEVLAAELELRTLSANLISGYHRDLQLTKRPFLQSLAATIASLRVTTRVMRGLVVNREACERACTAEIHATERAYELVRRGMPFRDAYRQVAAELRGEPKDD